MGLFRKQKSETRRRPGTISSTQVPKANRSVYSYHQNRSSRTDNIGRKVETDEKLEKRNKHRTVQHIPTLLMVLVLIVCLVYISTLNTTPRIEIIDGQQAVKGTNIRDEEVYRAAAEKYLNGSIVNRSKFLVDSDGLSRELKKQFPEIAAATVTIPIMGRRPVVELQATRPAFILKSGNSSMLIGNNGVALVDTANAVNLEGMKLLTVTDESGVQLEEGKAALPQEQAQFVSIVVEQLQKQGYQIESLTIPKSPYDLNVKITGKGYYVKFNILEDPLQQAGSYIALSKKLESEKISPKEYIDVRVGERIYYR